MKDFRLIDLSESLVLTRTKMKRRKTIKNHGLLLMKVLIYKNHQEILEFEANHNKNSFLKFQKEYLKITYHCLSKLINLYLKRKIK